MCNRNKNSMPFIFSSAESTMNGPSLRFPAHREKIHHNSRTTSQSSGPHLDPHSSVDDYNRVMLQYTQRQMAAFTKGDPSRRNNSVASGSSGSSGGSSNSSGNSSRNDLSTMNTLERKPGGAGPSRGHSPSRGRINRHQNDAEGVPPQ